MFIANNLQYHYSNSLHIQQFNYHFRAQSPSIWHITGNNGAGKTTFFNLLAGFLQPMVGEIFNNNINITALPPGKRNLSYLLQEQPIIEHLDVEHNIILGNKKINYSIMNELMNIFTIDHLLKVPAHKISGGEKSKVMLIHILLQNRSIILLDEPFNNINITAKIKIINTIKKYIAKNNIILLFTSHNQLDADIFVANEYTIKPVRND